MQRPVVQRIGTIEFRPPQERGNAPYHFNIVDGVSQPDPEGTDLVDLAEVRRQALRLSGEVLRELSSVFWEHPEWSLTVTDDAGATVLALKFVAEQAS